MHELDFTRSDGKAGAAVFARRPMWHSEGVVMDEAPRTIAEALDAAGVNYLVEKRDVFHEVPGRSDYEKVDGYFATVRQDNHAALGVVRGDYKVLQNRDAFAVLQPLIDNGLATWETGGALRAGRDVWGLVKFNMDDAPVDERYRREVQPYGLITNNHAGMRVTTLTPTEIVVVCANTHRLALAGARGAEKIRHTLSNGSRVVEAAQRLWGDMLSRHAEASQQYVALRQTFLDEEMFRRLILDVALPMPELGRSTDERARKALATRQENMTQRRQVVVSLWDGGTGHTGDRSAWEAFNALTEAMDHRADAFPVSKRGRVDAAVLGRTSAVKDAVLLNLLALSA